MDHVEDVSVVILTVPDQQCFVKLGFLALSLAYEAALHRLFLALGVGVAHLLGDEEGTLLLLGFVAFLGSDIPHEVFDRVGVLFL